MLHTLKGTVIAFPPYCPKQTSRNQVPNLGMMLSQPISPAKQQVCNIAWHYPHHANRAEHKTSQTICKRTMQQQMTCRFTGAAAKTTPTH